MQKPSQTSINNYNLVWDHYECTDEEILSEKKKIKSAMFYEVDKSYTIIAAGICHD